MLRKLNLLFNPSLLIFLEQFLNLIKDKLRFIIFLIFKQFEVPYIFMGFLLGRATIFDNLSPFAIPFFAVMYCFKKDKILMISLAILLGTYSSNNANLIYTLSGILIFFLLKKIIEKRGKNDLSVIPIIVSIAILIPQLISHIYTQQNQMFPWMMSFIEAVLGLVLTLIFVQAIPILIYKKNQITLNQEEIIALTIVLASVMTGTLGWSLYDYQIEHILSRYFILLFAIAGGGPIGAAIGVVTGLIISLSNPEAVYQISLLAFSGLLAGLLKQGNKIGVAIGFLLGTSILSVYLANQNEIINSFSESMIAILLFFLTPKTVLKEIAKYIPGTYEFHSNYQEYVNNIRKITSDKIGQFASMFNQLASSFKEISSPNIFNQNEQIDHFMNKISEKHCSTCWKRNKCWNEDFYKTYRLLTELMTSIEINEGVTKKNIPVSWVEHCVKHDQVAFELVDIYEGYNDHLYWRTQLEESRLLVAHQLMGVAKIMEDLSIEIKEEYKEMGEQEQLIKNSLEKLGLSIRQINILDLESRNVRIELTQQNCAGNDECSKVIAPLISNVLDENVIVKTKDCNYSKDGLCKMCLASAKNFEIESGYASAAKGGKWLSGDSFTTIEIGNGKYAVALSDGMGNGERAQKESKATLELLQQLLQSGIEETISIKTINSVLLLRSQEEIFSTIDLAIIDLFNGLTRFIKVGSTPSYIKRGNEIIDITVNNLPIGIIQDIDIEIKEYSLMPGDLLIMMTDGIYDMPKHTNNKSMWLKRLIKEIETEDPQSFADLILEKSIRQGSGEIEDDMTVVVSKIRDYVPEWSTIKVPGMVKIDRDIKSNYQ